ncbi:alpha/beta fold hydrolase, partial [Jeotgalibacillus terrae]
MGDAYKGFKSKEGYEIYQTAYNEMTKLWDVQFKRETISTSFGDVSIIVAGDQSKEPLVFFHAFGFSSLEWYKCAERLADDFELYFIDVLGEFNQSNTKEHLNEREDYDSWITEVFDQLQFASVSIIGHSNGGWHAINYACLKPDRVKSLVILSPAASIKRMNISFYFRLFFTNMIPSRTIVIKHFCDWLTSIKKPENQKLFEVYYNGQKFVQWEYVMTPPKLFKDQELEKLTMPVFLAVGKNEVIYNPYKMLERASEKIKSSNDYSQGIDPVLPS